MTRFYNCGRAFCVDTDWLTVTTTPTDRVVWSRDHARCDVCGLAAAYTEETMGQHLFADWACPIHNKECIEIDYTYIDSLFGIPHTDLYARID